MEADRQLPHLLAHRLGEIGLGFCASGGDGQLLLHLLRRKPAVPKQKNVRESFNLRKDVITSADRPYIGGRQVGVGVQGELGEPRC